MRVPAQTAPHQTLQRTPPTRSYVPRTTISARFQPARLSFIRGRLCPPVRAAHCQPVEWPSILAVSRLAILTRISTDASAKAECGSAPLHRRVPARARDPVGSHTIRLATPTPLPIDAINAPNADTKKGIATWCNPHVRLALPLAGSGRAGEFW
jgi:hypothetical protein